MSQRLQYQLVKQVTTSRICRLGKLVGLRFVDVSLLGGKGRKGKQRAFPDENGSPASELARVQPDQGMQGCSRVWAFYTQSPRGTCEKSSFLGPEHCQSSLQTSSSLRWNISREALSLLPTPVPENTHRSAPEHTTCILVGKAGQGWACKQLFLL